MFNVSVVYNPKQLLNRPFCRCLASLEEVVDVEHRNLFHHANLAFQVVHVVFQIVESFDPRKVHDVNSLAHEVVANRHQNVSFTASRITQQSNGIAPVILDVVEPFEVFQSHFLCCTHTLWPTVCDEILEPEFLKVISDVTRLEHALDSISFLAFTLDYNGSFAPRNIAKFDLLAAREYRQPRFVIADITFTSLLGGLDR